MDYSVFLQQQANERESELETFREYAIDFATGEVLIKNNEVVPLEENEALKVWAWRSLKTERNKYLAYTSGFGSELSEHIGTIYNPEVKKQIIISQIEECLKVNPYIIKPHNFEFEYIEDEAHLKVYFAVDTVYGTINFSEGVEI